VRKQQTVMFMLDVSRSMADNDQSEKRKIDVAREAFKQIISLIRKSSSSEQSNQKVGFVAFGGKCGELRGKPIEPAYNNLRSIEEALNNPDYYEPDGSTPLAYAVQKVTTILKEQKEHERYLNWLNKFTPTIILITDGSDTCKGFPVNQIQEAKKQGINFVVIIIAYCINEWESDVKILPQIAEASNGYYFSAETEEELQERVEQSVTIQNTEKVDFKKGKLEKGKIQLISTMNNVKKWELWQTKNSSSFAVMESTDAGEHDVRVGDYELFVYFKDQQPVFRKKLSVRKNKTVVERV
jgi:Mg-chelatase subunit ChlD